MGKNWTFCYCYADYQLCQLPDHLPVMLLVAIFSVAMVLLAWYWPHPSGICHTFETCAFLLSLYLSRKIRIHFSPDKRGSGNIGQTLRSWSSTRFLLLLWNQFQSYSKGMKNKLLVAGYGKLIHCISLFYKILGLKTRLLGLRESEIRQLHYFCAEFNIFNISTPAVAD